jgi:hypothetical protein
MEVPPLEHEQLQELPCRLETCLAPVIVINTQVAVAINAANFGGSQAAVASNAAALAGVRFN